MAIYIRCPSYLLSELVGVYVIKWQTRYENKMKGAYIAHVCGVLAHKRTRPHKSVHLRSEGRSHSWGDKKSTINWADHVDSHSNIRQFLSCDKHSKDTTNTLTPRSCCSRPLYEHIMSHNEEAIVSRYNKSIYRTLVGCNSRIKNCIFRGIREEVLVRNVCFERAKCL